MTGIESAIERLEAGLESQHPGYQLYASVHGDVIVDAAGGERRAGSPMTTDTITMWFSAGKPLTAVAIAQLWERGALGLDDLIVEHIPEFSNDSARTTVRHVLTHTSAFPYADDSLHPGPWTEVVDQIAKSEPLWPSGTAAAYHGTSGFVILGEIVRRIDGRSIAQYVEEEIMKPIGMDDSFLALPPDALDEFGSRLATIEDRLPTSGPNHIPGLEFEQFNEEPYLTAVSPGNTSRGPARELGYLYEALLAGGTRTGKRILLPTTVEALTACHRHGMDDQTFAANGMRPHPAYGHAYPWGLGVELDGNGDIGTQCSRRSYGSSGAFSSVGFADPEVGLACVIVTTGLIELTRNGDRLAAVADAIRSAV